MDSDVEMLEQKSVSALLTPGSPLALPPTESQQVSPIDRRSIITQAPAPMAPHLLTSCRKAARMAKGKVSPPPPSPSPPKHARSPVPIAASHGPAAPTTDNTARNQTRRSREL